MDWLGRMKRCHRSQAGFPEAGAGLRAQVRQDVLPALREAGQAEEPGEGPETADQDRGEEPGAGGEGSREGGEGGLEEAGAW